MASGAQFCAPTLPAALVKGNRGSKRRNLPLNCQWTPRATAGSGASEAGGAPPPPSRLHRPPPAPPTVDLQGMFGVPDAAMAKHLGLSESFLQPVWELPGTSELPACDGEGGRAPLRGRWPSAVHPPPPPPPPPRTGPAPTPSLAPHSHHDGVQAAAAGAGAVERQPAAGRAAPRLGARLAGRAAAFAVLGHAQGGRGGAHGSGAGSQRELLRVPCVCIILGEGAQLRCIPAVDGEPACQPRHAQLLGPPFPLPPKKLQRLEMARFTRRHPQLLLTLLKQFLKV